MRLRLDANRKLLSAGWQNRRFKKFCCLLWTCYVGLRHVRGRLCLPLWKEVLHVLINELIVRLRLGAALPSAHVPWLTVEPSATAMGGRMPDVEPRLCRVARYAAASGGWRDRCRGCPRRLWRWRVPTASSRPMRGRPAAYGLPTNNMKQFVQDEDPRHLMAMAHGVQT